MPFFLIRADRIDIFRWRKESSPGQPTKSEPGALGPILKEGAAKPVGVKFDLGKRRHEPCDSCDDVEGTVKTDVFPHVKSRP